MRGWIGNNAKHTINIRYESMIEGGGDMRVVGSRREETWGEVCGTSLRQGAQQHTCGSLTIRQLELHGTESMAN